MLFDMTSGQLEAVSKTTFAAEQILERTHLQAAVRDNIGVLDRDLLVVAEEFGSFQDAKRRIDLLCVDRSATLVVVELKRTEDGGHMELQAIRYAAMLSVMTFDDLVETFDSYRTERGLTDGSTARERLLEWLDADDAEPVVSRQVRIILASADFSQEITTTVLWLNDLYGMDIRCVRLSPYRLADRLLLDVQQVIPLPEAEELTIRLKKREAAVREHQSVSNADYTKYVISSPDGETVPLPKRKAVLALVHSLSGAGVTGDLLATALPKDRFRAVDGELAGDELWEVFRVAHDRAPDSRKRWFVESPIHDAGRTWVLHSNWGTNTEAALEALVGLAPERFSYRPS
ncbi:hypothetical protein CLV35_1172 [Motilibacter peucedani]|uniref:Uncharacterized protein n=1 Tax=Motilibacter peucedani TaxID=598650 RepID=A0A420XRF9_9ACTN|nr:hypothetical protein [Motilibacter peucedani]RKS77486.1 hypothetical protein CLV35_1172 [Motilibacter peucedani]